MPPKYEVGLLTTRSQHSADQIKLEFGDKYMMLLYYNVVSCSYL